MTAEERFASLQLTLPPAPKAMGLYRPVVTAGQMVFTAGHGPLLPDGAQTCGCVGADLSTQQGYAAARQAGLAMLATLRAEFESLDKIDRLVKTVGFVRCAPDFSDQPAVVNGFSELMREVFGNESGVAARSAVGAGSLPAGWAVEVEAVFLLKSHAFAS